MRKLSFGVLVFAAVIVFASAFPLDNGNGPEGSSVGLKAVEKNRLGRKPPGKPPGPKLVQQPVNVQFGNDQFGNVALDDVRQKAFAPLSYDHNKKGGKHDWASVSNDNKKNDKKKDLVEP